MSVQKYFVVFIILLFFPLSAVADTIITDTFIDDIQTWTFSESPYVVPNSSGADIIIAPTGVLNIEAGVLIKVNNARKFEIYGTINILGEPGNEVVMTNPNDSVFNISDRWGGMVFYPGSTGNINFLNQRHTGWVQFSPGAVAVMNRGGSVSVNNSTFTDNSYVISNIAGETSFNNSTMDGSVVAITQEGGVLNLIGNTISNTSSSALIAYGGAERLLAHDNSFINNLHQPFVTIGTDWDLSNNTFVGGDYSAWHIGGSIQEDYTLQKGLYVFNGSIVEVGATLTIEPGTTLKGTSGSYIIARDGIINMIGTESEPIIFTSIADDSTGGDTNNDGSATDPTSGSMKNQGIIAEPGGTVNISHVNHSHAGIQQTIGPWNFAFSGLLNLGGTIVADNYHYLEGIHDVAIHHESGNTTITNSSVEGTFNNIIKYRSGEFKISNSDLSPTLANYSIFNLENSGVPDARNNWWGTAEGPLHDPQNLSGTAAPIHGDALFIPWLSAPPSESQAINPVIIIPGIMGSARKNGELVIDPILHTYDDLIATLDANGYTPGVDLFTFPYEWRDSNVFSANLLDDKIDEIKSICACDKVDVVAHSMGGLVARSYIQSIDYDEDVDQVIFLGTPHKGSPADYLQWEAGKFSPDVNVVDILTESFFEAEALRNGHLTIFDYIRNRPISSVQELLPVFDYLKDESSGQIRSYPNNYPTNKFLENLNANIFALLNSGIKINNIVGNSGENKTVNIIRVAPTDHARFWEHGEPDGFDSAFGDNGLERGPGDNTVTLGGATLDSSIVNENSNASHRRIPTVEANNIYKLLTGKDSATNIDSGFNLSPKILLLQLLSPIDVVITAPDGKKIGKNFETGEEFDEIPNAFYSGSVTDEEYITILDPLDGGYEIELQGTDNGGKYEVLTSYVSDNFSTTTGITGITEANQITNIDINLDSENPEGLVSEKEITLEVLINDIEGAYDLGWIKDKKTRDNLIKQAKLIIKLVKIGGTYQPKIDKALIIITNRELSNLLRKGKINQQAFDLLKADLNWLIYNN